MQVAKIKPVHQNILSLDLIAILCCALLLFVMGKFTLTDLLGIKRFFQFILIIPIFVYFIIRIKHIRLQTIRNPLFLLSILLIISNIIYNRVIITNIKNITSGLAVFTILTVSIKNIILGVKCIVSITCFFSILAIFQFICLLLFPSLIEIVRHGEFHIINSLGLITSGDTYILGVKIGRIHSFLTEPSLVLVHFVFPAVLALFLNKKFWANCAVIIIMFCFLSMSASFYIGVIFFGFYWIASFYLDRRFIFYFFPIIFFGIGLIYINSLDSLISISKQISENAESINKTSSLLDRSTNITMGFEVAKHAYFGSSFKIIAPFPILIGTMLSMGYLGTILFLLFLYQLINNMDKKLYKNLTRYEYLRIGAGLFFGVLSVLFVFNDYAALFYVGLTVFAFFYRLVNIS